MYVYMYICICYLKVFVIRANWDIYYADVYK